MRKMSRFSSLTSIIFILSINPIIAQAGNWFVLTSDNFETGWGNYTSGGTNAVIYTYGGSGTNYAHQGNCAAKMCGGGTSASFYHTAGIDVATPGYTQIKIDFWFYAEGMECFWVQYNNGSTWLTVATYTSGVDFNNGSFYNETITIPKSSYTFPTSMRIRFRNNSLNISDCVYIDEIVVSGYIPTPASVPNVVGLEQTDAESVITGAGFPVGAIIGSYTNAVPLGYVISQWPVSGTVVDSSTPVDLVVSLGTREIDMEDLEKFAEHWLDSGCGTCGGADFSGDGDVDFEDFALLAQGWMAERNLPTTIVINEFMAANDTTIADPQGEYDDWIEIYNYGTELVYAGGMFIADDSTLWQIPDGINLEPNSYLLIWADDDVGDSPGLHANFKLNAGGEQIRLFKYDGTTLIDSINFNPQADDISHGRYPDGEDDWYDMDEPTPGAANKVGMAGEVWFSRLSGTFTSNFSLTLSTISPTAIIRYTTDGSIPTASSVLYSSPITIDNAQTRIIRARAYESGLAPGPVVSQTYLPLASDVQNFSSNLPIVIIDTFGTNIPSSDATYLEDVAAVFIDTNDSGRASIKDLADFAGRGGIKERGQSTTYYPKKQYRFEVWEENNADKSVSLLGLPAESDWILYGSYDDTTLMRNVLVYKWSSDMGHYSSRTRFMEVYLNTTNDNVSSTDYQGIYILMEKIKRDENRVDIAKLEKTDNAAPEITGGYIIKHDKDQTGESGFWTGEGPYNAGRFWFEDPEELELTNQQKVYIKGYIDEFETMLGGSGYTDPVNGYAKYIDVESFIDHELLVEVTKNVDAYRFSTYMYKDRNGKLVMAPEWDYNYSLGHNDYTYYSPDLTYYETNKWFYEQADDIYPEYYWWDRLRQDGEYMLHYADRWFELRENILSDANVVSTMDGFYALLSAEAADRNFSRWYPVLRDWIWPNFYFDWNFWDPNNGCNPHTYQMKVEWLKNWLTGEGMPAPDYCDYYYYWEEFSDRLGWIDNNIGYAFPPNFSVGGVQMNKGGHVSSGSNLTMAGSTGTIYYTLDGSDPRQPFTGNAVGTAYTGSITLNASVQVKARIKNVSAWSALNEATFAVGPVAENLRVTEIMYHPEDTGSPDDPNTEFIELKNIGASAINLSLVKFTNGIEFTFPNVSLAAGQYVLVVKDQDAFEDKYTAGYYIAGQYTGSLSNGGEEIDLKDAVGEEILDFEYEDGWYPITDGNDFTLNIINPADPEPNSWDLEESWQASNVKGGSPGAAYTSNVAANGAIVINEVMTCTDGSDGDWIELRNMTGASINIGGWFLSDNAGNFRKYEIGAGTTISAYDYKVFTATADFGNLSDPGCHTKFGLSELGETVYFSSGSAGELSGGYSIKEGFGAASKEVTFGRYTKSAAAGYDVDFVALAGPTKGNINCGPYVPAVVINEIMYNSATQYDRLAEYIELYNRGGTIALYDPANPSNTWKFTKGIDFSFPVEIEMTPGEYVLVVRCNPATFRVVYNVPENVRVFGPFENGTELDNGGEKVELSMPGEPEPGGYVPYIRVEQVNYSDGSHPLGSDPWPMSPDGHGDSLGREVPASYGNDVDNWEAVTPSPGIINP